MPPSITRVGRSSPFDHGHASDGVVGVRAAGTLHQTVHRIVSALVAGGRAAGVEVTNGVVKAHDVPVVVPEVLEVLEDLGGRRAALDGAQALRGGIVVEIGGRDVVTEDLLLCASLRVARDALDEQAGQAGGDPEDTAALGVVVVDRLHLAGAGPGDDGRRNVDRAVHRVEQGLDGVGVLADGDVSARLAPA
jgi:hypothetical protein